MSLEKLVVRYESEDESREEELSRYVDAFGGFGELLDEWQNALYESKWAWERYHDLKEDKVKWRELRKNGANNLEESLAEWEASVGAAMDKWSKSIETLYEARKNVMELAEKRKDLKINSNNT